MKRVSLDFTLFTKEILKKGGGHWNDFFKSYIFKRSDVSKNI